MVKAVVKNGVIVPRDPLPADWAEGTEVMVDRVDESPATGDALDRWWAELEAIAAQGDPEDDRRLDEAIRTIRQQQKELARKRMGLPDDSLSP